MLVPGLHPQEAEKVVNLSQSANEQVKNSSSFGSKLALQLPASLITDKPAPKRIYNTQKITLLP